MGAGEPALKGANKSVTSVSGAFPPVLMVFVVVFTTATTPASQMLTSTRLLSAAAAADSRKRAEPGVSGVYGEVGMHEEREGTATWPEANGGEVSRNIEGTFRAKFLASTTVTRGITHEPATCVSGQGEAVS